MPIEATGTPPQADAIELDKDGVNWLHKKRRAKDSAEDDEPDEDADAEDDAEGAEEDDDAPPS